MYIVRYEVCRENVPRDVASPNRTYRGDDFVDHGFITFVSYESLSTDGGKFYLLARGKKLSFIDSFTINVTTRIIIPR